MTPLQVLLIESLDAAGAHADDARLHARALAACGLGVRSVVLEWNAAPDRGPWDEAAPRPVTRLDARRGGLARLRAALERDRPELVVVAGAEPGGGPAVGAVPRGLPARWWPTGLPAAHAGPRRLGWRARRRLPPLFDGAEAPGAGWVCDANPHARGRLSLWDGEYLLAPFGLGGRGGALALGAFAELAGAEGAHDLVVLADPDPAIERRARRLAVGTRVHFVGRAPREAEDAWLQFASGALCAGAGAISGGVVLRALALGCALLAVGDDGAAPGLRAWLASHGAAPPGAGSLRQSLARLATGHPATDGVRAQGRALAAGFTAGALVARLAGALEASGARRAAA